MIVIDYRDKRPIYEQVEEKLSKLVVQGVLETDSKLPSVRALAIEFSINPNTIQRAYTQLEEKGYIYTIKGKGNYVSPKNDWIEERKKMILEEMRKVVNMAKAVGIEKEEFIGRVEEVYREEMT